MDRVEQARRKLVALRKKRGLSQQLFAPVIGVRSKVYVSQLETGVHPFTLELALRIEDWSDGEIAAPDLLPTDQARLLESSRSRAAKAAERALAAT